MRESYFLINRSHKFNKGNIVDKPAALLRKSFSFIFNIEKKNDVVN